MTLGPHSLLTLGTLTVDCVARAMEAFLRANVLGFKYFTPRSREQLYTHPGARIRQRLRPRTLTRCRVLLHRLIPAACSQDERSGILWSAAGMLSDHGFCSGSCGVQERCLKQ